jgi:hypothetical protein
MTDMLVQELSEDGLSRKAWSFMVNGNYLVLQQYAEEERKTKRHGWKGPKWSQFDERKYYSALDRPTEIPAWVYEQAASEITFKVAVGWVSPEHVVAEVKLSIVSR